MKKSKYRYINKAILSKIGIWCVIIAMLSGMMSCHVTKNLPEGEVLYTGYKVDYINKSETPVGKTAQSEIGSALDKKPSTKLFGFVPIPFGMWVYNDFVKYKKGVGKWIFNKFAPNPPVFISAVNSDVRTKIGTNLLYDYGYFNGNVTSKTIVDPKDSLKASITYTVDMRSPWMVDTLNYINFAPQTMKFIQRTRGQALIKSGDQFNVPTLDQERSRVSTLLRNVGFFYFRPDYLTYQADTLISRGKVSLRMLPVAGLPQAAQRQYYVGNTEVFIMGRAGEVPNDSVEYKGMKIHYYDKLHVRPKMLYRWINYQQYVKNDSIRQFMAKRLYSQYRQQKVQQKLAQTGIFSYMDLQYTPKDTMPDCDTLNVVFQAALAKAYDAELEFNIVTKSSDLTGPAATFSLTKYNVFGGGESWNIKAKGSYEWQTGGAKTGKLLNSWEMGLESSLTFPRVVFPRFTKREYNFPATTTFKAYVDQLNRSKYYKLLAFGANVTYDFQRTVTQKYSISPLQLTFNVLQHETDTFKTIAQQNPALYVSLENQFIPAMNFTYTWDNSSLKRVKNPSWFQASITPAGNLLSCVYAVFGDSFSKRDKSLLGTPFAQFLKLTGEYRYLLNLNKNNAVAMRVGAGAIFSYGNRLVVPYTEQFYIGGANSIRAYTARGIGPGGTEPTHGQYGYLQHVGTFRVEANIEWRFRLIADLWGATFLDSGNIWLLRYNPEHPYGQLKLKDFPKQIALGTGVGLRYDLQFLVFRIDVGVPIHNPYETTRKGYYNVTGSFWKQCALHFAIGYPF